MNNYFDEFSKILKSALNLQSIYEKNIYSNNEFNKLVELENQIGVNVNPLQEIDKSVASLINSPIHQLLKHLDEYPEKLKHQLIVLGNNGWFMDLDMPVTFTSRMTQELDNGNHVEAEAGFIEYFKSNLQKISEYLINKHPHRSKIISSAFFAHFNSFYELSIPVFLAQSDGLCYELIESHYFIKSNKKPSTSRFVESLIATEYRKALLYPLSVTLPISASVHERGENFNELNRHQILHGEVVDYGSEINSLKSISLLNYISQVLSLVDN